MGPVYFLFLCSPHSENGATYLPRPGVLRGRRSQGVDTEGGQAGGTGREALHAPPRCVGVHTVRREAGRRTGERVGA